VTASNSGDSSTVPRLGRRRKHRSLLYPDRFHGNVFVCEGVTQYRVYTLQYIPPNRTTLCEHLGRVWKKAGVVQYFCTGAGGNTENLSQDTRCPAETGTEPLPNTGVQLTATLVCSFTGM
jgi:hypothetical protein